MGPIWFHGSNLGPIGPYWVPISPFGFKLDPHWLKVDSSWHPLGSLWIPLAPQGPHGVPGPVWGTSRALKSAACAQLLRVCSLQREPPERRKCCQELWLGAHLKTRAEGLSKIRKCLILQVLFSPHDVFRSFLIFRDHMIDEELQSNAVPPYGSCKIMEFGLYFWK